MFYFNPRGLRRPRPRQIRLHCISNDFNPRGLRRPRLHQLFENCRGGFISIHEVFADLDATSMSGRVPSSGFQSTRSSQTSTCCQNSKRWSLSIFQSTRSSQTSTELILRTTASSIFQSTRSSQTSTRLTGSLRIVSSFQSTRSSQTSTSLLAYAASHHSDFNPRGLRRPRPRSSPVPLGTFRNFNPRGLRRPRRHAAPSY